MTNQSYLFVYCVADCDRFVSVLSVSVGKNLRISVVFEKCKKY